MTVKGTFYEGVKFGKSSFLRKQESSLFNAFWIPAYAGMTEWGYVSKVYFCEHGEKKNGYLQ